MRHGQFRHNTPVRPVWRPYWADTATESGPIARQGCHKRGVSVVETPAIVLWEPWSPMIAESRRLIWAFSKQTQRFCDLTWYAMRTRWGREERKRRERRKKCWARPLLVDVRRSQLGHFNRLMLQLTHEDPASFHNFLRIPPDMFDELLCRLAPKITKQDTNYIKAIDPGINIADTLCHLASGDTYASMTSESHPIPYLS